MAGIMKHTAVVLQLVSLLHMVDEIRGKCEVKSVCRSGEWEVVAKLHNYQRSADLIPAMVEELNTCYFHPPAICISWGPYPTVQSDCKTLLDQNGHTYTCAKYSKVAL